MYYPVGIRQYITERMRQLDNSALSSQFSGVVALGITGSTPNSLSGTSQVKGGNFYSYLVDVNNTRLVPTSGTSGTTFKCYFLPGRILQNIGDTNRTIGLGGYDTLSADYLVFPMPDMWYPTDYPKGNVQDTPSGNWATYEWYPFNNGQKLYYLRNNTEYTAPSGGYVFREERVILVKLGYTQTSTTNFNFVFNDSVMTYDNNPTRIRAGGLDKNTIITYMKRFKNKIVNQTTIT